MTRIRRSSLFLVVFGLGLALVAGGAIVAGKSERKTVQRGKARIVVIDDDGNRHEDSFEFDGDRPRAFLGVRLADGAGDGARVERVIPDSAAERAGFRSGDRIVRFDGEPIDSAWDLTRRVLRAEPGRTVDIEVLRDGRTERLSAELGESDDWGSAFAFGFDSEAFEKKMHELHERLGEMDFDFQFDSEGFERSMEQLHERLGNLHFDFEELGDSGRFHFRSGRPLLGVELVGVTPELREHLGGNPETGVLIGDVIEGTPAEAAGIRVGDLLVAVDGEPIDDAGDLRRALRGRQGESFGVQVIRDGRPMTLTVTIPDTRDDDAAEPGSGRRRIMPKAEARDAASRV